MDLQSWTAFLAVAETGSFSQAAERLCLSQPAISKRIRQLEAGLNRRLFDRLGREIRLTEAGAILLPLAREAVTGVDSLRARLEEQLAGTQGTLALVTSHHIGLRRLPPLLRQFVRHHPQVRLDLAFMDSEQGCAAVAHGNFELGVVTLPVQPPPGLVCQPVWTDHLVIAAAPDHPLAGILEIPLAQLARYPAILPAVGTFTRTLIEAPILQRAGRLDVVLETNYLETIRTMVATGLGWSALPEIMLGDDVVALDVPGLGIERLLGLVRREGRSLSRAATAWLALMPQPTDVTPGTASRSIT